MRGLFLLLVVVFVSCKATPSSPELQPLPPPPPLETLDAPVREQFQNRYDFVVQLRQNEKSSAESLGWAFGELGQLYHAYQHFDEARSCYQNARLLDPREFRWPYYLGHVERIQGDLAASDAAFESALAMRPDDVALIVWMAENDLDSQRFDAAATRFEAAIERDPGCVRAFLGRGRVEVERGDDALAILYLEAALAEQEDASAVHYALGRAYRGLGEDEKARAFLQRTPRTNVERIPMRFDDPLLQAVSDLRRSAQYHVRLGQRALFQERYEAAIREFEQALAVDSERSDARYNLAAALLQLGRREAARAELEVLAAKAPDHVLGRLLRARMLAADGDLDAARAEIEAGLAVRPDDQRLHRLRAQIERVAQH